MKDLFRDSCNKLHNSQGSSGFYAILNGEDSATEIFSRMPWREYIAHLTAFSATRIKSLKLNPLGC